MRRTAVFLLVLSACGGTAPRPVAPTSTSQDVPAPARLEGVRAEVVALDGRDVDGMRAAYAALVSDPALASIDRVAARLALGRALVHEDQLVMAVTAFRVALEETDVPPDAAREAIEWLVHVAAREPALASYALERLVRSDPATLDASLGHDARGEAARAYVAEQRLDDPDDAARAWAIATLSALDVGSMRGARAHVVVALARLGADDVDGARAMLEDVATHAPLGDPRDVAWLLLGHLLVRDAEAVGTGHTDSDRLTGDAAAARMIQAIDAWAHVTPERALGPATATLAAWTALRIAHPRRALAALAALQPGTLREPPLAAWLRARARWTLCDDLGATEIELGRAIALRDTERDALVQRLAAASEGSDSESWVPALRGETSATADPYASLLATALELDRAPFENWAALETTGDEYGPGRLRARDLEPRVAAFRRADAEQARFGAGSDELAQFAFIARSFMLDELVSTVGSRVHRVTDSEFDLERARELRVSLSYATAAPAECTPYTAPGDLEANAPAP